jgi:EAL domain-containing protein (putative c-di-GMP-specific phosphodiesterase class I)/ABC-type lipoprotein export system ATPase subunit
VARIGGDEFAILMAGSRISDAQRVAEAVVRALEVRMTLDGHVVDVRASIGVAVCPDHGHDPGKLMQRADIAMRAAKRDQLRVVMWDDRYDENGEKRLSLMSDLKKAVDNEELTLTYQPRVALGESGEHFVEALLRWQHPTRGLVPPSEFVPLAEQTGYIRLITQWVLSHAVAQCAEWRNRGLPMNVSVNISACDLVNSDLPLRLEQMLEKEGCAASWITLEVSENAIVGEPGHALKNLERLHNLGCKLALDDFGASYSTLAYLRRLPLDELKVDKSFTMGMATDASDALIVRSTIELAHKLGLVVIAGGVEDEATLNQLRELGCDAVQGFLVSRPLPAEDVPNWVKESPWARPAREEDVAPPRELGQPARQRPSRLPPRPRAATLGGVLSIRQLGKTYAGAQRRTVLNGVDLELAPGDYVAVMGESGIGKSTLLNLVAGLDRPDTGSIRLDGVDLTALDDDALTALRRVRMGFVFQAFHVLPYLTVGQNVALPLSLVGVPDATAEEKVRAMLGAIGLGERSASMPRELSGGELQRVAIARALVHGPQIVLADEPTGNLDPESAGQVLRLLRTQVKSRRAAGILVTHSQAAAASADRILVLSRDGLRPRVMRTRSTPMAMVLRGSLAQNRTRTVLAVVAIALGVALGYAVQLINAAAVNELAQGVQTLSGDADLELRGPRGGFAESIFPTIARMADVAVASPVVEVDAKIEGGDMPLRILGLDVFRAGYIQPGLIPLTTDRLDMLRPDALFMSPAAARSLGVAKDDTLHFRVALADVALRVGRRDRIGGQSASCGNGHCRRTGSRSIAWGC